jgi:Ca2+-binding RTX toxin-like protein
VEENSSKTNYFGVLVAVTLAAGLLERMVQTTFFKVLGALLAILFLASPFSYGAQYAAAQSTSQEDVLVTDTTNPTVTSKTPANGKTGVTLGTNVKAVFSEEMDPDSINGTTFTLTKQGSSTPVAALVTYDEALKTAKLDPNLLLENSTTYTATITTGAKDLAGNALEQNVSWTFTTVAAPTNPTVTSKTPANGKTDVTLGTNVKAVFSEEMDPDSINGTTFTLTKQGSSTPVAATVTYDQALKTAKLDPNLLLENSTTYTATITTGAKDLAGNALEQNVSWTFTTVAPPPSSCTITGTSGDDVLEGTSGDDVICGLGGKDTIRGHGGNDTLKGGDGNDTIEGGAGDDTLKGENNADKLLGGEGNDTLDGGAGADTASFKNSTAGVQASLLDNTATGEGSDILTSIEHLEGSNFNDQLTGSSVVNNLTGLGGVDTLSGGDGADKLSGGTGNDTLYGGLGNDTITGQAGADAFYGEDGDDALNSKDNVSGNDALDGGAGTDACTTDVTEKSITSCP